MEYAIAAVILITIAISYTLHQRIELANQRIDILREHLGLEVFNRRKSK